MKNIITENNKGNCDNKSSNNKNNYFKNNNNGKSYIGGKNMSYKIDELIKKMNLKFRNIDGHKLLIGIVVDENNNLLMTAFLNEESLRETLKTGYMHYYSTSRKKLWKKGEESGNTQKVKEIYRDCDGDALLFIVEQKNVSCHTGHYSCFHNRVNLEDGKIEIYDRWRPK